MKSDIRDTPAMLTDADKARMLEALDVFKDLHARYPHASIFGRDYYSAGTFTRVYVRVTQHPREDMRVPV
jgi:hypothetical protein